jgi:hypothetical protein
MKHTVETAWDVWSRACHLVFDQSGRARLHDTRAALNSIAIGLEVLRHELDDPASPNAGRVIDIMNRDLVAAADELAGLHALVTATAHGPAARLGGMVEWAETMARPVARRCGIELVAPAPDDLPVRDVDPRLGLALAVALVEAMLAGARGSRCALGWQPAAEALVVEWDVAPTGQSEPAVALPFVELMLGPGDRLAQDGAHRALTIALARAA